MTRRKMIAVALVIIALFAAAYVSKRFRIRVQGITEENFKRLHVGMTEEQVDAILGKQADYKLRFTGNHYSYWVEGPLHIDIRFSDLSVGARGVER